MDNDVYINSGESFDTTYYPEPALTTEQKEEIEHDASIKSVSFPIMTAVADWFAEQVEACDSRRTIVAYAEANGLDKQVAGEAFDILRGLLEAKAHEFEEFRSDKDD